MASLATGERGEIDEIRRLDRQKICKSATGGKSFAD